MTDTPLPKDIRSVSELVKIGYDSLIGQYQSNGEQSGTDMPPCVYFGEAITRMEDEGIHIAPELEYELHLSMAFIHKESGNLEEAKGHAKKAANISSGHRGGKRLLKDINKEIALKEITELWAKYPWMMDQNQNMYNMY